MKGTEHVRHRPLDLPWNMAIRIDLEEVVRVAVQKRKRVCKIHSQGTGLSPGPVSRQLEPTAAERKTEVAFASLVGAV